MRRTTSVMIGCVLILLTLGIVMLTSTSGVSAETMHGDAMYFVKRQVVWMIIGTLAAVCAARLDCPFWVKMALPLALFVVVLLAMTLIPGVGVSVKGSRRWLRFAMISIQPSELAKPSMVLLLAWWFDKTRWRVKEFRRGLLIPMLVLGVFLGLIFLEPDYGTTLLVGLVGMSIMYAAGTRFIYLLVTALVGAAGFAFAVMRNPLRMRRIMAFLNPEKYAQDEAFQLLNAVYAFVVGDVLGVGLGQSIQKRFYLPEAHTDFIFAIVAEELGFLASGGVVILFGIFFFCGLKISMKAPDHAGRLTAFGLTMMITAQAAINIGVVTGCLPTKGLPLPFVSFGGSSMVASLFMVGLLAGIAIRISEKADGISKAIRDSDIDF